MYSLNMYMNAQLMAAKILNPKQNFVLLQASQFEFCDDCLFSKSRYILPSVETIVFSVAGVSSGYFLFDDHFKTLDKQANNPDYTKLFFQRWILITFVLNFGLPSIMIMSKIRQIRVKNQDNLVSLNLFWTTWQNQTAELLIRTKFQPDINITKKTQHENTLNLLWE